MSASPVIGRYHAASARGPSVTLNVTNDLSTMYHVYPNQDEREHELEGTTCWCGPRVEWSDPKTGEALAEAVVIHNAADCREIVEEAERILAKFRIQ